MSIYSVTSPIIVSQPKDQEMDHYGGEVILSVQVATHCGELKYEWLKNREAINPDIYPYCREVNCPELIISQFMREYEGRYKCKVSNGYDSVESRIAKLSKFTTAFL